MSNNLYIDVGNTMIKINYQLDNIDKYVSYYTNKKINNQTFSNSIKNIQFKNVYLCSVVPVVTPIMEKLIQDIWNIKPIIINREINIPIYITDLNKREIGGDIIAIGAFIDSQTQNGILVNLGTTTTIIHVKNHKLQGVIICPGLMSSFKEMISKASQLREFTPKIFNMNIGINTKSAISIGVLNGHYEMVNSLISKIDPKARVYISGGDAKQILPLSKYIYVKEATIKGMKILGKLNE